MPIATALMCIVMSFLVFGQIKLFGMGIAMLRLASASIDRTLQTEKMAQLGENGSALYPEDHGITFDKVCFSYENKEILHGIDAVIPDKTTTAVIGPSGSGKTTLCNLIARFWDVDSGSVRIGGHDVREYTLESLMDQISMVFQNVYLFADTIENNIKFGRPDATHAQVVEAAKKACCAEFIEALPDGYSTVIGEGGASLSGGEKALVAISIYFAIMRVNPPPFCVLDEIEAALDDVNVARFAQYLRRMSRNSQFITITHRRGTMEGSDMLYGVTMQDQGISKLLALRTEEAAEFGT